MASAGLVIACVLALASLVGSRLPEEPGLRLTAGPACTSFCLDNNGYPVHATNLEHDRVYKGLLYVNRRNLAKEGLDPGTTGEIARWTSKYGSITFNLVGYEYAWGGMNEAGLTISTMSLRESRGPSPDKRPPLHEPFYAQYLLDTCAKVEEVMDRDAEIRIQDPQSHFLVCDRTGECATVEFLKGRTVYHSGDDLPVKALTNNAYRDAVKAWRKGRLSNQSLVRFGIAADRAQGFEPAGDEPAVEYAFDTLAMADGDRTGGPSAQWSIVFDAERRLIHFRTKRTPQIRTIELAKIDFACDAEPLMLDIHGNLAGDISQDFEPYSHKRTVEHFVQFFEEWNLDVSRETTEGLVRHLEAFSCAEGAEDPSEVLPSPPKAGAAGAAAEPRAAGGGPGWLGLIAAGAFAPAAAAVWYVARRRPQHL
jgi:penicillin V acylase-like amidase (Ntn superfamily)